MKQHYVYILCSKKYGTLYIGVTNNIYRKIYEHRNKSISSFSKQYNVIYLIHIEHFLLHTDAIAREKKLKKWKRQWKINLINKFNPQWKDLSLNL